MLTPVGASMATLRRAGLLATVAKARPKSRPSFPRMPASSLRIPPRYKPGLDAAAALSAERVGELSRALRDAPRHLTTGRLAQDAAAAIPDLSVDSVTEMLEALLSLIALPPEDGFAAADLARDVAWSQDLTLDDSEREAFASNLTTLLGLETLVLAARAHDVVTEAARVFHDARIISDVRPVFLPGANIAEGPRAAVLVSNLKIEYHEARGPINAVFFALDHSDLVRLQSVVDRALAKVASLQSVIDQMGIPYWEYQEPTDAADS
jgi:hypothetical protein